MKKQDQSMLSGRLCILLSYLLMLFSAGLQAQVNLYTKVPTVPLHVGIESSTFATGVINQSSGIQSGFTVDIRQPEGVSLDASALRVFINNTQLQPADVILNGSKVEIANASLAPSDTLKVLYQPLISCAAVTENNHLSFMDTVVVSYSAGGSAMQDKAVSDAYNIKWPGLMVITPSAENASMKVAWRGSYRRPVKIKNSPGAGKLNRFTFTARYEQADILEISSLSISSVADSANRVNVAFVKAGNLLTALIDSNMLKSVGLGTTLDGGEELYLWESFKVVKTNIRFQTDYVVEWSDGLSVCNHGEGNAYGSLYLAMEPAYAGITQHTEFLKRPDMCDRSGELLITWSNTNPLKEHAALDVLPVISCKGGILINQVTYEGNPVTFVQNGNDFMINVGDIPLFDTVNDNLSFNDFRGDTAFSLHLQFTYPGNFTAGERVLGVRVSYADISGMVRTEENTFRDFEEFKTTVFGVSDVDYLVDTSYFTFSAFPYDSKYEIMDSCPGFEYYARTLLPEGMVLTDQSLRPTTTGEKVIVPVAEGNGHRFDSLVLGEQLKVFYSYNGSSVGYRTIEWEFFQKCSGCDSGAFLASNSWELYTHDLNGMAQGGYDDSIPHHDCSTKIVNDHTSLRIERRNFGYTSEKSDGIPWYSQDLISLNKGDISNEFLHHTLVTDTLKIVSRGRYEGSCDFPDSVIPVVYYINPEGMDVLEILEVKIVNNTLEYSYPLTAIEQSIENGEKVIYRFPASMVDLGSQVAGDLSVEIIARVKTNATASKAEIKRFRTYYQYRYNGFSYNSDHYGDKLWVFQPKPLVIEEAKAVRENGVVKQHFFVRNDQDFVFNKEFRPVYHFTGFLRMNSAQGYKPISNPIFVLYNDNPTKINFSATISGQTLNVVGIKGLWPYLKEGDKLEITYNTANTCASEDVNGTLLFTQVSDYLTGSVVSQAKSLLYPMKALNPSIQFGIERNQPGYTRDVRWSGLIANVGERTENAWMSFDIPTGNSAAINIGSLTDADGISYDFLSSGTTLVVNLGAMDRFQTKDIFVDATYSGCGRNSIDSIFVTAGWDKGFVTNPTQANCSQVDEKLLLTHKSSNIQAEAYKSNPTQSFNLCDNIGIDVTIANAAIGNMYGLGFWMDKPANVMLQDNKVRCTFKQDTNDITSNLSVQSDNIAAAFEEINDGLSPEEGNVNLHFDLQVTCGSDGKLLLDNAVRLFAGGITNCGDTIVYEPAFNLPIEGFEQVDSLVLSVVNTDMTARYGESDFTVTVQNRSNAMISGLHAEVIVPKDLSYVAGSTSGDITIDPTGTDTLVWDIPSSAMNAGAIMRFGFRLADQAACPGDYSEVTSRIYLQRILNGCGSNCLVEASAGVDTNRVKMVRVSLPDTIMGSRIVCKGATSTYITHTIAGATDYHWGIIPDVAAMVTENDTQAVFAFSPYFSGNAQLYVIGQNPSCPGGDTAFISISVVEFPEVTLEGLPALGGGASPVVLTAGLPEGGTYSGEGITSSPVFDPSVAGSGAHQIVYTYTDSNGCTASDTSFINVSCNIQLQIADYQACLGDTVTVAVYSPGIDSSCGYDNFTIEINYDPTVLSFIKGDTSGLLRNGNVSVSQINPGFIRSISLSYNELGNFDGSGDLFRMVFEVLQPGASAIDFERAFLNMDTNISRTNGTFTGLSLPQVTLEDGETCFEMDYTFEPVSQDSIVGYLWNDGSLESTLTTSSEGTYSVEVTDINGCKNSDSATLNIVALPTITVHGDTACVGDTITVTVSTSNINALCNYSLYESDFLYDGDVLEYVGFDTAGVIKAGINPEMEVWNLDDGYLYFFMYDIDFNPMIGEGDLIRLKFVVESEATTTLTLSEFTVDYWDELEVINSTASGLGLPDVDAGTSVAICYGQSATLAATGGTSYRWSTGESTQTIDVAPQVATIYTVTATNVAGCEASDSVSVSVNSLPVITISPDTGICYGQTVVVTAEGGINYAWSNGETSASITVSPEATTLFEVIGTNENSCSDTASMTVTIYSLPVSSVTTTDSSICEGRDVEITASGGVNYLWSTGDSSSVILVTPASSTQYFVTVTDIHDCEVTDSISILVNMLPSLTLSKDTAICVGQSVVLEASSSVTVDVTWSNGVSGSTNTVSPLTTTLYAVTISDGNACESQDSVTVSVNSLPIIQLHDTGFCSGSFITLDAGIFNAYQWSNAAVSRYITVYDSGMYAVTVTDANGCSNDTSINIEEYALPVVELVGDTIFETLPGQCIFHSDTTNVDAGDFNSYHWSDGSTGRYLKTAQGGDFSVTVSNGLNCEAADTVTILKEIFIFGDADATEKGLDKEPTIKDAQVLSNYLKKNTYMGKKYVEYMEVSADVATPYDSLTISDLNAITQYYQCKKFCNKPKADCTPSTCDTVFPICTDGYLKASGVNNIELINTGNEILVVKKGTMQYYALQNIEVPEGEYILFGYAKDLADSTYEFYQDSSQSKDMFLYWIKKYRANEENKALASIPFSGNATEVTFTVISDYKTEKLTVDLKNATNYQEVIPQESLVRIYPNPVKNLLTIEAVNEISSFQVFNMEGKSELVNYNVNLSNFNIRLDFLAPGLYIINVYDLQGNINSFKFEKE